MALFEDMAELNRPKKLEVNWGGKTVGRLSHAARQHRIYHFENIDDAKAFRKMFNGIFPYGLSQCFAFYTVQI